MVFFSSAEGENMKLRDERREERVRVITKTRPMKLKI